MLIDGVTEDDVKRLIGKEISFEELSKFAVEYSDAAIIGSENINENLKTFIENSNKPFLPYQPQDTYIDAYNNFYDKLMESEL